MSEKAKVVVPEPAEDVVTKLKGDYGEIYIFTSPDDEYNVVCKSPPPGEWKRFMKMSSDKEQRHLALSTLFRACTIYPDTATIGAMLDRKPGLAESFGGELAEYGGLTSQVRSKKL